MSAIYLARVTLNFAIIFSLFLFIDVYGIVEYSCSQMQENIECLNKTVQYQCIVTDSVHLRWRITDENMILKATETYSTSDLPSTFSSIPNAGCLLY